MFVMDGALLVTVPRVSFDPEAPRPILAEGFALPTKSAPDARLIGRRRCSALAGGSRGSVPARRWRPGNGPRASVRVRRGYDGRDDLLLVDFRAAGSWRGLDGTHRLTELYFLRKSFLNACPVTK